MQTPWYLPVLSALLTQLFIPSTASVLVWSSLQQLSKTDHKDVLPALTASEHLKITFHDHQAQSRQSDLRTGCLYLEGMRNRSRKVSSNLSLHSSFPWFSSLQPLKSTYVCLLHHPTYSKPLGRERKARKRNFTTVVCTLQKGAVAVGTTYRCHWGSIVKNRQVNSFKNLQFFSSQRPEGRQHQHYRGQTRELKSKFSCFKSGQSVRINTRRIGWMMDQLCRRAYLAFDNWFRNISCTHNLFCHRFVLISSVLSNTFLRISILQNILFFNFSTKKNNGKFNSTTWSIVFSNGNTHTLKMKGSYYPATDKETKYKEELPATDVLGLKTIS